MPTPTGPDGEQLRGVLDWVQDYSGLNDTQPVLLREDEDGLFALLPTELAVGHENSPVEDTLCVCWCLDDTNNCSAFPNLSVKTSEEATGDDAAKLLAFLKKIGYTNLYVVRELPEID